MMGALWVIQPTEIRIYACRRNGADGGKRDASRSFRDGAAIDHADRLTQQFGRHVVEQHGIHADCQSLSELSEGIDLDLDFHEMADRRFRALKRGANAARHGDVVVLDQDGVVQPEAMIATAAGAHRLFLENAQPRRRFSRANDARVAVVPRGAHKRRGDCCDA